MKFRSNRLSRRAQIVGLSPLLLCATASADVLAFNEANTTNVWTLPAGTNLLAGAPVTPGTPATHESSSGSWATLTDGVLGAPGNNTAVVTPNNNDTVTYALDVVAQPLGYDITTFDSYATWGDSGRDNQNFSFQVSTVADPGTFNTVFVVNNVDSSSDKSTHTSLTDTSGVLAGGVHSVRIVFGNPQGQENGYVGMSELFVTAVPTNVNTVVESNTGNVWTLPPGANLLNGATAIPATTDSHEGSNSAWTTVTNGVLGTAADIGASVTPNDNRSVTFPLDLSVNFNGYNLTSFDTYCSWPNSGRDNTDLSISYSTVAAPTTFIKLANAVIHTGGDNATHVRITPAAGFLASGVAAIKVDTGIQENGYVGYREFIALGTAVSISDPLTWTGSSGAAGNANWITAADNNWKKTLGGAPSNFNPLAALTFEGTGTNRNISIPVALTASSLIFDNTAGTPYTISGQLLTVSNDVLSSGSGSATFNNAVSTTTGVTLSGSGSLAFNGALQATGLTVSGPGGITLNAANPALTGNSSVSAGTLTVTNDGAMQNAALVTTGGVVRFLSAAPQVASLAGTAGSSVVLGNTAGPVNTNLSVGDALSVTTFAGDLSAAGGTTSGLTKTGASSLVLSGVNTYNGATTVSGGLLQFDQRLSLYNGSAASWTAGNIIVGNGGTLGFKVGTFDEFTDTDINTDLSLGGFQPGSALGIINAADFTLSRNLTRPGMGLYKTGSAILNLTGTNTSNGLTRLFAGTINAAGTGGAAINGDILMGNGGANVTLNMGGPDQLAATGVITFANGSFYESKVNLRGTPQTVAGLDSAPFPANRVPIIQNDEIGQPGYPGVSGPASLTINATGDHSFYGLIRNQDGGPVSVIKDGPGTQELRNSYIQGYGYTGPTTINEGTLRINFAGVTTGFGSNITVGTGARLEFNAVGGDYNFDRELHGPGQIAVTGVNALRFRSSANSFTGGLTVGSPGIGTFNGFLALVSTGPQGAGNGPGQTCVGGAMIPTNVITVQGGATLALDGVAPLGESTVVPAYAPSIVINNSGLNGGSGNIAFVSNLTLNNGDVSLSDGLAIAGFDTNLCFVGTVVVDGDSTEPSTISTSGAGPNANASLGSAALPGTIFDVADVTGSSAADLLVSSILRNVNSLVSPLTKTGSGTMSLSGANTYTGDTTVSAGELTVSGNSIVDTNKVVLDGGKLGLAAAETVGKLFYGAVQQIAGTYGSTSSAATYKDDSRFSGTAVLTVTTGPSLSYEDWALVITNGMTLRAEDADGDGIPNLDEFLFGTSPIASNGSLTTVEDTGGTLVIRWSERLNSSSVYVLQESTTLSDPWSTSGVIPATDGDQTGLYSAEYVRKQAVIPIDSVRKFVRVEATE